MGALGKVVVRGSLGGWLLGVLGRVVVEGDPWEGGCVIGLVTRRAGCLCF